MAAVVALASSLMGAMAQTDSTSTKTGGGLSLEDNFAPGFHEVSVGVGPMFSPIGSTHNRPKVNYVLGMAQVGYMLNHPAGPGPLRGNFEVALEAFGAGIWEETGHYIAGGTVWGRYNFIPEGWPLVPYAQFGLGGELLDIDHRYDGHNFNFNVDAAGGVRFFVNPRFSVNAECRFQHFSNANTGSRNIGVNALGPILGASWFF